MNYEYTIMSYKLLIVESPAKCKKIESYLGIGYKCVASFGHIRELNTKKGLKCIDISNGFSPYFIESPSKRKQISKLRHHIAESSEVILATDDDREGEAIAWHICKVFKLPVSTTKRIIFHEITKTALQRAVAGPTTIDMNKVNAQLARQVLDLLVGFTISPLLWKHITKFKKASLSAGRCQTPALRLVYDNQKEIEANPGKGGYDVTGYFTKLKLPFKLDSHLDNNTQTEEFLEESVNHEHMLSHDPIKQTSKKSPVPLTTSAIQQKASNVCGYSPKQTMAMCQILYEGGHITYMRTDSKTYSKEFIEGAKTFIENKYGSEYIKKNVMLLSNHKETSDKKKQTKSKGKTKSKKSDNNAQEAHEAIRPTKINVENLVEKGKIGKREARLYRLIWSHSVESCMEDARYKTLHSSITSPIEPVYKYTSEQVVFPGWKIVNGYEKESKEYKYLQKIVRSKPLKYHSINANYSLFQMKQHYSEAKLVSLLEKKGIGRPSTFSSLITKIQEREYVKKGNVDGRQIDCVDFILTNDEIEEVEHRKTIGAEKNKMIITPTGSVVIEFLVKYFDSLFNYEYTKHMEDELDIISQGNKQWTLLCETCNSEMHSILSTIQDELQETYEIDENHTYMIGRYGPVIRTKIDGKTKFLKVKDNVSLDDIRSGTQPIDELIVQKTANSNIGQYKSHDVCVKDGKYGVYAIINKKTYALKHLGKSRNEITLEDVINVVENKIPANKNIIRVLNDVLSIRKSKYGNYVFYKTASMKKPKFLKLKGFEDDIRECEDNDLIRWITNTYSIDV